MRTLIVFNGPPGCGKDEAVNHLVKTLCNEDFNTVVNTRSFKTHIIRIAADILGITEEEFLDGYNDLTEDRSIDDRHHALNMERRFKRRYRRFKEVPLYTVGGTIYSKREWLIHVSENIVKKSFGEAAFGKMFALDLPEEGIILTPDSGFPEELVPAIEKLGHDNVVVIRIKRQGYSYEATEERDKDSRRYLEEKDFNFNVAFYDVQNVEGDLSVLQRAAESIVGKHYQ